MEKGVLLSCRSLWQMRLSTDEFGFTQTALQDTLTWTQLFWDADEMMRGISGSSLVPVPIKLSKSLNFSPLIIILWRKFAERNYCNLLIYIWVGSEPSKWSNSLKVVDQYKKMESRWGFLSSFLVQCCFFPGKHAMKAIKAPSRS